VLISDISGRGDAAVSLKGLTGGSSLRERRCCRGVRHGRWPDCGWLGCAWVPGSGDAVQTVPPWRLVMARRSTASEQVSGRQGRSNVKRERKRKGPMRLMPPSGHTHTPSEGGGGGGGGAGAGRGGPRGGQGRVQGRQHSDVSTARLPVSTRTLRGCLIGEGQVNKDIFPPNGPLNHPWSGSKGGGKGGGGQRQGPTSTFSSSASAGHFSCIVYMLRWISD
jgi:hypothetical protein